MIFWPTYDFLVPSDVVRTAADAFDSVASMIVVSQLGTCLTVPARIGGRSARGGSSVMCDESLAITARSLHGPLPPLMCRAQTLPLKVAPF